MSDGNGTKSPTWKIIAISLCSVVVILIGAWATDVSYNQRESAARQTELLQKVDTLDAKLGVLGVKLDMNSERIGKLEARSDK